MHAAPQRLRFVAVALLVLGLSGCKEAQGPTKATSPTPSAAPTPAPTPTPALPVPTPTPSPAANRRPQGEFRYTPDVGYDGDIHVGVAESVRVNAARFQDPDGDALYLTVDRGDGRSNHISCGLCRLEYAYRKHGRFTLRADVTDLRTRPVSAAVTVRVD
jgi:hypothetical protein